MFKQFNITLRIKFKFKTIKRKMNFNPKMDIEK